MKREMRLSLVIAAFVGLLVLGVPALGSDANLVAHWALDEGGGTIAYDSAGDNNGILVGDPAWTIGQVGGALEFDGDGDFVEVPHDNNLNLVSAGTVAAWVNLNDSYRQAIATKQPGTGSGNYYLMTGTGRSMLFGITNGTWSEKIQAITSGDAITNEWTFYVGTFDGNSVNLYENSVLVNSLPNTIIPVTTTAPLYIGRWGNNADWDCGGSIDEVMIFNRALSAEEVEELYWEGFSWSAAAIGHIEDAIAEKLEALETIDAALEEEWAAYDALEELLASGDYEGLSKRDIDAAQRKIESAVRRQERSKRVVLGSIEELEDALLSLGWEPEAEPNEPMHEPSIPVPGPGKRVTRNRVQR